MTLGRIGAGMLRPVNVNERPYPWVGSGTHLWLHFDSRSTSHVFRITSFYYPQGTTMLNWGDGSSTVSFTNSGSSDVLFNTGIEHEYADGDYRIDITGPEPIKYYSFSGFTSGNRTMSYGTDPLIQFETDALAVEGNGGMGFAPIGATRNCRWMMFTEATTINSVAIGHAYGLIGLWAPKCKSFFRMEFVVPNMKDLNLPSVETFFNGSGANPGSWFNDKCPSLEKFVVPEGVTTLPQSFMAKAYCLRSISLPTTLSGTLNGVCQYCYCLEALHIPEGVDVLTGQVGRECYNLKSVTVPSTVTQIDSWCFYECQGIDQVVCRAQTPPVLGNNQIFISAKNNNASFGIWVPQGTISAYEAATNWSQFAGKFHELDANGNIPQT